MRFPRLHRRLRHRGWLYVPLVLAVAIALVWGRPPPRLFPREQILDAIRMVESSGRENPPDGDGGAALGPYQIHRIYWTDAIAQRPALGGRYEDCRNRAYAERVITAYMERWVSAAWQEGDAEIIARTHNGGPTGAAKRATDGYWRRVRERLVE